MSDRKEFKDGYSSCPPMTPSRPDFCSMPYSPKLGPTPESPLDRFLWDDPPPPMTPTSHNFFLTPYSPTRAPTSDSHSDNFIPISVVPPTPTDSDYSEEPVPLHFQTPQNPSALREVFHPSVHFNNGGRTGINVADILDGVAAMDGASDAVLADKNFERIRLRIFWPGYPAKTTYFNTRLHNRPITRMELAHRLAWLVHEYLQGAATQRVDERFRRYEIPSDFRPSDLFMSSLEYCDSGVWYTPLQVAVDDNSQITEVLSYAES